jgi:hydroxymethylpyrimidine pyrophosphatase-like HAD family hydrolase
MTKEELKPIDVSKYTVTENGNVIKDKLKNEWHEIKSKVTPKREISKKYMPKNKEKVLLKYHFSGDNEIHISDGYYDAYDFEFHIANNPKYKIVCVIAWKEIVLPKEIE